MKRKLIALVLLAVFALTMTACGAMRDVNDTVDELIPDASMNPDWNDGLVTDGNGLIGDETTPHVTDPQPSPAVSARP